MHKIGILKAITVAAALVGVQVAHAQYPERQVRLIVPVTPGGGSDILARTIGDRLSAQWRQKVLVENRPGAGHILGTSAAAKSEADGHTLLLAGMPHVVNPALHERLPYRSDDFEPVILVAQVPIVAVTHPTSPFRTVGELVDAARKQPGEITFASTSPAGSGHLAGELLKLSARVDMVHVPYKGSSAALQDVLAGRVPVMFDALVTAAPHIQSGKLLPLAVTVAKRSPDLPNVPTMEEAGYPGFFVAGWLGLLAPKGTPASVLDKVAADVANVLREPEVVERLRKQSWEIMPIGPGRPAFGSFLRSEEKKWTEVVRAARIKAD